MTTEKRAQGLVGPLSSVNLKHILHKKILPGLISQVTQNMFGLELGLGLKGVQS